MADTRTHYLLPEKELLIYTSDVTEAAHEIEWRLMLGRTAAVILGRALAAVSILGASLKDEEKISLQLSGNGSIGQVFVDAASSGGLRGFVKHSSDAILDNSPSDFSYALGTEGILTVMRSRPGQLLANASVPMRKMDVSHDVQAYLNGSEQVLSSVALLTHYKTEIEFARGVVLQKLPKGDPDDFWNYTIAFRQNGVHQWLNDGMPLPDIVARIAGDTTVTRLKDTPLRFQCTCSRDKVATMIKLLGPDELRTMIEQDESGSVRCEFCREQYNFTKDELQRLLDELSN